MNPQSRLKTKSTILSGRSRSAASALSADRSKAAASPISSSRAKRSGDYVEQLHYFIAVPAFSFADTYVVDTFAEPIASFHYTVQETLSVISIPQRPAGANFNLVLVTEDGTRYKVWDEGNFQFPLTLYTGQLLGTEFQLEIWATDDDPISSEEIRLLTSNLATQDADSCSDEAIEEAYSLAIPFMYATFAERYSVNVELTGNYWPLVVLEFTEAGSLDIDLTGRYDYSLEELMSLDAGIESSSRLYAPTFDSTRFTFDSTLLRFDTNVT